MWEGCNLTGLFACNLMLTCNGKTPRAASSSPGSPTLDNRAPLPSPKDSLSIAAVQIKAWQTRAGFDDVFCSDTQKLAQTMCDTTALQKSASQLQRRGKITALLESMLCFLVPAEGKQCPFVYQCLVKTVKKYLNVFLSVFVLISCFSSNFS